MAAFEGELEELYHEMETLQYELEAAGTSKRKREIQESIDDCQDRIDNAESED